MSKLTFAVVKEYVDLLLLPFTFIRYFTFARRYRIERRAIRKALVDDEAFREYLIEFGFSVKPSTMILKSLQIVSPAETDLSNEQIIAIYRARLLNTIIEKLVEKQLMDVTAIDIDRLNRQLIEVTVYPCNILPYQTFRNALYTQLFLYACLIIIYYTVLNL